MVIGTDFDFAEGLAKSSVRSYFLTSVHTPDQIIGAIFKKTTNHSAQYRIQNDFMHTGTRSVCSDKKIFHAIQRLRVVYSVFI